MSRSKIKLVLLSCALALSLVSLSFAQDAPALDSNFDPSIHDVSPVPRLPGPATESNAAIPTLETGEQVQHNANKRPTIIVRPAVGCPGCLNECQLEVEPLSSGIDNRFRLKLSIPESVEIVELVPQQSGDHARSVRVLLDPGAETIDSVVSMLEQPETLRESLQLVSDEETKSRYQANPFFAEEVPGAQNNPGTATVDNNDFVPSPFRLSSAKVRESTAKTQLALKTNIIGPRSLAAGASAEFEINLLNPTSTDYRDVLVQLQLPAGLEPLMLDRTAWLDASRRTVSWEIDELKSGQLEVIHYAILTTASGPQLQKISVGIDGMNQGEAEIRTVVTSPFEIPGNDVPANTH